MQFGFGQKWNDLKTSVGSFLSNRFKKGKDLTEYIVKALDNVDDESDRWQDMAVKEPLSKMGKTFDEVLIECQETSQKLSKNVINDDWELKLESVGNVGNVNSLRVNADGKMTTPGILNMFFKIGDENNVGLNVKTHKLVSLNAGIRQKLMDEKSYRNSLWSSTIVHHPAAVCDLKLELVDEPDSKVLDAEFSAVYGHKFDGFGILAGFKFGNNSCADRSDWRRLCMAFSLGFVSPANAMRLVLQPGDDVLTLECYRKINDSVELAVRASSEYDPLASPTGEVGVKYRQSENVAYGIKSDIAGNITAGTWLNSPSFKVALFATSNIMRNIGMVDNVGISVEI